MAKSRRRQAPRRRKPEDIMGQTINTATNVMALGMTAGIMTSTLRAFHP